MKRPTKFDSRVAKKLLPKRRASDNKSSAGKSLIIAGSRGMFGAAVLSAMAAARVGSGYVILMTDLSKFSSSRHPDFLTVDWKSKVESIPRTATAIGPGLGKSPKAKGILRRLIKSKVPNVVMDADALNLCAENKWFSLPSSWILTPHEGELARLLGVSAGAIRKDRLLFVRLAQKKMGCVVLLKGNKTLIATPTHLFEIQSGNAALAKAGTGDVLTGMIVGFLAQGLGPSESACLAAFIHGKIADNWIRSGRDVLSLMASDLIEKLPETLFKIRKWF